MIAKVGSFRLRGTVGTQTFDTGLGVTPDALYLLVGPPAATSTIYDGISCGLGWVDSHGNQYGGGLHIIWDVNYTGHQQNWANAESTSQAIYVAAWPFPAAQVIKCAATVTAIHADGTVDLNVTTVDGGGLQRTIGFLALSGVDAIIGSLAWASGTVTVNPWSPNKTPTWVSLMSRPGTGTIGMAHAPDYGQAANGAHPAPPLTTAPGMASGDISMWEAFDHNGDPYGVLSDSGTEQTMLTPRGGVWRTIYDDGRPDQYWAKIVANGFTFQKVVNFNNSTISSMHYMAVKVTDVTIRAEHIEGNTIPESTDTDISDLTVRALMTGGNLNVSYPADPDRGFGAYQGHILDSACWGFADPAGNQISLFASVLGGTAAWKHIPLTGPGDPTPLNVFTASGIYEHLALGAHGTYDPSWVYAFPAGIPKTVETYLDVNISNPDQIVSTYTHVDGAIGLFVGAMVLGPVKGSVVAARRKQIVRYR